MERLIRILLRLADSGDAGVDARRLDGVACYQGDAESGLAALRRDVRRLRQVGWDIEAAGDDGAWRAAMFYTLVTTGWPCCSVRVSRRRCSRRCARRMASFRRRPTWPIWSERFTGIV